MINLVALFRKYNVQLLFIVLEITGFILVFNFKNYHHAAFVNSANNLTGGTYSIVQNFSKYLSLREVNDVLAKENAELRSMLPEGLERVNGEYFHIKDTLYHQEYLYRQAEVIRNSTKRQKNYITLNLGSKDGITSEMGVIAQNGVVGVVGDVSENFCTVMSFLHPKMDLSCKIKRNNASGWMKWPGGSSSIAQIKDVPITTRVYEGDSILTSGFSSIFPAGIYLGKVKSVEADDESQTQKIEVLLSLDFNALSYVYVVENLFKEELNQLEAAQEDLENE